MAKIITKKRVVENRIKNFKRVYNSQPITDEERFTRIETLITESYGLVMVLNHQLKRLEKELV